MALTAHYLDATDTRWWGPESLRVEQIMITTAAGLAWSSQDGQRQTGRRLKFSLDLPNTNSVFLSERETSQNSFVATIKSSTDEEVAAMGIGVAGN
ncbi:hypothetical protein CPC08DRAFT_709337, partial [Agrocybe pediades]